MKQPILKALANPTRIFYVPYGIAITNFLIQFIIFVIGLIITKGNYNPLLFLIPLVVVHLILIKITKKEPQIGQILSAKLKLFLKGNPPKTLRP